MGFAVRVDHWAIHRLLGNASVTAALIVAVLCATLLAGCSRAHQEAPPAGPYRIIELFDGDSFNLRAANGATVRVRIAGIDAPEKKQPYSVKAKESLEALLLSGDITLDPIKRDRFDRWVANVVIEPKAIDVGLAQIERGYAWFFIRYKDDLSESRQRLYAEAEREARRQRIGLWAGISASQRNPELAPEEPWRFRERTKKQ
jgi:endonuclease YncB( thermonuclease family)